MSISLTSQIGFFYFQLLYLTLDLVIFWFAHHREIYAYSQWEVRKGWSRDCVKSGLNLLGSKKERMNLLNFKLAGSLYNRSEGRE